MIGTTAQQGRAAVQLEAGLAAYARRAWEDAYRALAEADAVLELEPAALGALGFSAALTGRDREMIGALDRQHEAHLARGEAVPAARAAFWTGMRYFSLGEPAQAGGWLARCHRLIADLPVCAEHGFLLLPATQKHLAKGELAEARQTAARAAAIGVATGDADLICFARCLEGRAALRLKQIDEGLTLLDEAMVAAGGPAVSPLVAGLVYCSVIAGCQQVFALERCREWTSVLARWCEAQPQLGIFTGICLVHRAEVLELNGDWTAAAAEIENAATRLAAAPDAEAKAAACYRRGELMRLRGDIALADEAYRAAAGHGLEPQPGLALLRLAEGNTASAKAQISSALAATHDALRRARFLPAAVEIALASDDRGAARVAAAELSETAAGYDIAALDAMASHAIGSVRLAEGDASGALEPLRAALAVWLRIGAPYLGARVRVDIAGACRQIGDAETAAREAAAADAEFNRLGAATDLRRLHEIITTGSHETPALHRLSARECEVLRLVATGLTNKGIARKLDLSEKTVDRHVSNILLKLDVPTRAAATAAAYRLEIITVRPG